MKAAFLVALEENSQRGVVRPFINWANAVGERAALVFYRCPEMLRRMENSGIAKSNMISADSQNELLHILSRDGVDCLISDDYTPRARLLLKLAEKLKVRKCIYVQVLYGLHALVRNFSLDALDLKSKFVFSSLQLIPFRLLSGIYHNLLKRSDILVANSNFTASFLRCFYRLEADCVVYPPVDEVIFRPHPKNDVANVVVLYCGSDAGDTHPMLLKQLLELLIDSKRVDKVEMFGNNMKHNLLRKMTRHPKVSIVHSVSDMRLAQIYSESILTIAPQEWETFGYVPIESVLCGTPFLAFASQPCSELVREKNTAHLVYSRRALLEKLKDLLADVDALRMKQRSFQHREDLLKHVSKTHSADMLLSILG